MAELVSKLFQGDERLEACLAQDSAHVTKGCKGDYVAKIQYAVLVLEGGKICGSELQQRTYGPETAKLVKAYKTRRKIINASYQRTADDIVGKMTIRALDVEFAAFEINDKAFVKLQNAI
jgi:hypothetical protein